MSQLVIVKTQVMLISGIGEIRFKDSFQNTKVDGIGNTVNYININLPIDQDKVYTELSDYHKLDARLILVEKRTEGNAIDFKKELAKISDLIGDLEIQLCASTQNNGSRVKTIEIVQAIQRFKDQSIKIESKFQSSVEAADWLSRNLTEIVIYTSKLVFDDRLNVLDSPGLFIPIEDYKDFQNDLYVLYVWIMRNLDAGGATPRLLKKQKLVLPIEYKFYGLAFERVIKMKISKLSKQDISKDAVQLLVRYINRFLIRRDCQEH